MSTMLDGHELGDNTIQQNELDAAWRRLTAAKADHILLDIPTAGRRVETALREDLPQLVTALDMPTIVKAAPGRTPSNLAGFRLTPIPNRHLEAFSSADVPCAFAASIDTTVTATYYTSAFNEFVLDGGFGIGLVYEDHLVAVAGACVHGSGRIVIKQLQDVTGVRKFDANGVVNQAYYRTGLQRGLLWRHTLISAWEELAHTVQSPGVVIMSHQNSYWDLVKKNGRTGYDDVAAAMGYAQDEHTLDWEKPLATNNTTTSLPSPLSSLARLATQGL